MGVDVQNGADFLRQHRATDVAVPVSGLGIETKGGVAVAIVVALWMDTTSMQPVTLLLESLAAQYPNNLSNDPWIQGHLAGRNIYACGWQPFSNGLTRFKGFNPG